MEGDDTPYSMNLTNSINNGWEMVEALMKLIENPAQLPEVGDWRTYPDRYVEQLLKTDIQMG